MTSTLALPERDGSWTDWLQERVDGQLAAVDDAVALLKDATARDTEAVLDLWNDAETALRNAGASAGVLVQAHPDKAVRDLAEEAVRRVDRIETDLGLDRDLFEVVAATPEPAGPDASRLRARLLRDFRRAGVDRDDATRSRLREIAERLTELDQDFGRAIREDVRLVRLRPEQLDGLPDDYRAAHPAGDDGLVAVTTDYPDFMPFRTFAHDPEARRALVTAFLNRAWPQNDTVLQEMLALRTERAGLLGYDSWPDYDSETKMIGTGQAIGEFVETIAGNAAAACERDLAVVLERARQDRPDLQTLTRADGGYYEELVRREQYAVAAQALRRYFDFAKVRAGMLDVTARLFGVGFVDRADVSAWHEDVTVHDVVRDDEVIGRVYLDLHPRDGKFKHAAQFVLVPGVAGRQLPEGVLECNFPTGLMEHTQVTTLFHEFGHLMHHVLAGGQRYARFGGVSTEWDFVEAPSQMLEEWAWDTAILRSFATDENGRAIPAEQVAAMRAGREFGKGLFVRNQIGYAALSYELHRVQQHDTTAVVRELQQRYDPYSYLDDTHMQASFGHLAGYTSAYYTYLWSLVIAKDLLTGFDTDDLLATGPARRYVETVLAPGGSRDAADLVADFLGRPSGYEAFTSWLDEAPAPALNRT